jgi:ribosomal protein L37AE/L43A
MREVGGGDPESEENISTFWDSVEIKQKDVTMSLVDCPRCNKRLRIPEAYSGIITCSNCNKVFKRENEQIGNNLYDSKGRLSVVTDAQRRTGLSPGEQATRFAIGGGLELLISAIIFLLFIVYTIYSW